MQKKQLSILSIILFVIAGLLAVVFVLGFITCYMFMSDVIIQGSIPSSGHVFYYYVFDFYGMHAFIYLFFAILFMAAGFIVQRLMPAVSVQPAAGLENTHDEEEYEDYSTLGNLAPSDPSSAGVAAPKMIEDDEKADVQGEAEDEEDTGDTNK